MTWWRLFTPFSHLHRFLQSRTPWLPPQSTSHDYPRRWSSSTPLPPRIVTFEGSLPLYGQTWQHTRESSKTRKTHG